MPSSWEELPPDLLGQVLHRLPSLADRVRFCAVCWPWRTGAIAERLPPPLPWLAFRDGTIVDHAGAPIRCAPILREEGVDFGYLAVDNLAFLVHHDGSCSLMNPLSGLRLPLPKLGLAVSRAISDSKVHRESGLQKAYVKAVLSSPLDSTPDPLIAVLILEGYRIAISTCKQDSVKQGNAISTTICPDRPRIHDIAFFHRKLYTVTGKEGLHAIELDADHLSKLKPSSGFHQCIADDPKQQEIYCSKQYYYPEYLVMRYLTECDGRLLMLRRWMRIPPNARLGDHDRTVRIEVFEAVLDTLPSQWTKVETLGGHAIFLDSECSKSVLASQFAGGVQEDCVYFMHQAFDNPSKEYFGPCVDPLADSGVYNMRDGEITPLLPEAVMAELQRKRQFLTWFFPANE